MTTDTDDVDPVEKLLRSARDEAIDEEFHVTGVMIQYYEVCERELWFVSRHLEIDRDNAAVVRGTRVDDEAYSEKRRNVSIDGTISIDVLDDGTVMEVKPSSSLVEPARLQLLYYLWYLDRVVGVQRDGVLAHPTERERESVELTPESASRYSRTLVRLKCHGLAVGVVAIPLQQNASAVEVFQPLAGFILIGLLQQNASAVEVKPWYVHMMAFVLASYSRTLVRLKYLLVQI